MATQVESIKWVPGTSFIVDGFRFQTSQCQHYFLTHAHSDHTTGLTRHFSAGLIYCSPITFRLLIVEMGVNPQFLRVLELDRETTIDGVSVTAVCANHCPGAIMLRFAVPSPTPNGKPTVILHTGDFRWCSQRHGSHPVISNGCDVLMLDTTYCLPKWTFPLQNQAVTRMAEVMRQGSIEDPATLFVCMSYHIGKERAYFGAALILGWKIWVSPAKRKTLQLLDLPSTWMALLVSEPKEASLHVLGMGDELHAQTLADRVKGTKWSRVVVLRPTGWSYRANGNLNVREEGCVTTIGIPYSEHSSFAELRDCVKALRPKKIIPTVNAGNQARSRAIVDRFCDLMDLSGDKSRLDAYFGGGKQERSVLETCNEDGTEYAAFTREGAWLPGTSTSGVETGGVVANSRGARSDNKIRGKAVGSVDGGDEIDLDSIDVEEQRRLLARWECKVGVVKGVEQTLNPNTANKKRKGIMAYFCSA
jgi:DNA cross-link repair 1A protein